MTLFNGFIAGFHMTSDGSEVSDEPKRIVLKRARELIKDMFAMEQQLGQKTD
jgi:hypothetical protein